jgi:hypothetical protein
LFTYIFVNTSYTALYCAALYCQKIKFPLCLTN